MFGELWVTFSRHLRNCVQIFNENGTSPSKIRLRLPPEIAKYLKDARNTLQNATFHDFMLSVPFLPNLIHFLVNPSVEDT